MIVVKFRRPTLTSASYTVVATLTVTGGTPTIHGAAHVVPTHVLVETPTGIVSYQTDPEAWAAHLARTPWCPFLIPAIVEGTNTPETDPHQLRPVRTAAAMAELADALPSAAPARNRGCRPWKQGPRSPHTLTIGMLGAKQLPLGPVLYHAISGRCAEIDDYVALSFAASDPASTNT